MPTSIRFCPTPAGRVAYSVTGSGPFLLCDTGWVSHLEKMLDVESFRGFIKALANRFSVVRHDKPGSGLSDRPGVALTFDDQVATVVAIADEIGARVFHLFGASQGGQVAVAVAARHPDRVTGMALYGTCARGADLAPPDVRESLVALVRAHGGLGSTALSGIFMPDATAADLKDFVDLQRTASTASAAADLLTDYYRTDVTAELRQVRAPTLVLHREGDRATPFRLGREVASLIPGATFMPLQGSTHMFWKVDWRTISKAITEFLPVSTGPDAALTGREMEVAALVAEGRTNQKIAEKLFISARTAEAHLENIRQKLGFRSRAQIATWYAARRPVRS